MKLKKGYKIISITMILIIVMQISHPLLNEVTLQAQGVIANTFNAETSLNNEEVSGEDNDGIVDYDSYTAKESMSIDNDILVNANLYNQVKLMNFNNLNQEDIDLLNSLTQTQIDYMVDIYTQEIITASDSWTLGDPLPSNGNSSCDFQDMVTSGNKYYQGGECSSGIDNPHDSGSYYIYYDESAPIPDDFQNYSGPFADSRSIANKDVSSTAIDSADVGELCPYISTRFFYGNDNIPTNQRRDSGCDYPYEFSNMTSKVGLVPTEVYDYNYYMTSKENNITLDSTQAVANYSSGGEITGDMVGNKYTVSYFPILKNNWVLPIALPPVPMDQIICDSVASSMIWGNTGTSTTVSMGCEFSAGSVLNTGSTGLTVEIADDMQLLDANDIVVPEVLAPRSDAQVLSMSNAHFIELENIHDRYNVNHTGDIYNVSDVDYMIDTGDYDYSNPTPGTHMVEITAISPTTGFEVSHVITIEL